MARPTKLTRTRHDSIVKSVRAGNFAVVAARANGIDETTYYRWIARGEADIEAGAQTEFSRFCQSVKDAEAKAELEMSEAMWTDDKWQRRAWWLERRFPKRWGQKQTVEHSGPEGAPIEVNHRAELISMLDRRRAQIEEAQKALAEA